MNFAIAINYEFTDAPNNLADYVWCENGEKKCGRKVLTRQSFMPDFADRAMSSDNGAPPLTNKRKRQDLDIIEKKHKRHAILAHCSANSRYV